MQLESDATFLESTLNACQEWFQDRDRVLRSPSVSSQRWAAFINFLSEMYLKVTICRHWLFGRTGSWAKLIFPFNKLVETATTATAGSTQEPNGSRSPPYTRRYLADAPGRVLLCHTQKTVGPFNARGTL